MKAAVLHAVNQPLEIEEVTIRKPGPRQVLIRTAAAGLCHSDLHCMEGLFPTPLPIVLGHESAGIVEQVGSEVTYVKPGDTVITCTSVFCGVCDYCTTGHPVLCQSPDVRIPAAANDLFSWQRPQKLNQFAYLGSFAEQMLVHENAVARLSRDVPIEIAAIVGCAVITGYGAVVNSAQVGVGESIAVLGCGGVGLAAINTAAIAGAGRIIAIDTNPAKLQQAAKLGATDLINPRDGDPVGQVKDLTGGGVQHALEIVGQKATAEQAFGMLRSGGQAVVVGMLPAGVKIELNGLDFLREKRIRGSVMGSNHFRLDIPRIVDLYAQGRLQLDDWISAKIQLKDINEGFAAMKAGKTIRSVIRFG